MARISKREFIERYGQESLPIPLEQPKKPLRKRSEVGLVSLPKPAPVQVPQVLQKTLGDWVGKRKERRSSRSVTNSTWEKALFATKQMFETGDWSNATPITLVATYALLHKKAYGVLPVDLQGEELFKVRFAANRFFMDKFAQDWVLFLEYAIWIWTREQERHQWRSKNGYNYRLVSYHFFGNKLYADWLVAKESGQTRLRTTRGA